jgi:hypothetical protein
MKWDKVTLFIDGEPFDVTNVSIEAPRIEPNLTVDKIRKHAEEMKALAANLGPKEILFVESDVPDNVFPLGDYLVVMGPGAHDFYDALTQLPVEMHPLFLADLHVPSGIPIRKVHL